ncbi:MAG: cytochrome c oxidase subunit 3 [Candidatus Poribacteria bacterium]|nr:cytochrome c oxidase subunit 3 [Candidatus Poribacteria bacterium]MDE0502827.1 cytochrome c oxidase subunit 3 [Candidatus Poribacteria bacterium]
MSESEHATYDQSADVGQPTSNARLAILIVLGAEIMFFAGLIGTFLVFRLGSVTWPPPTQADVRLPIGITGINTIVLLLSGYTMIRALRTVRRGLQNQLRIWLLVTGVLGAIFLIVQGTEWVRLVHHGFTLSSGVYGSIFYVLIGCHALHALLAVVWVLGVLAKAVAGRFSADQHLGVEICAIYWTFVVVLWPILYVLVYLV